MVSQEAPKPALDLAGMKAIGDGASPALMIDWPEPQRFTVSTYGPEVSVSEVLPTSLTGYIEAISKSAQTPVLLAIMFALSVISTCVQKKFTVSPHPGYVETLSLWTLTMLTPSNRKSRIAEDLMFPLKQWEKTERIRLGPEIAAREVQIAAVKSQVDALKSRAVAEPDEAKRQELIIEYSTLLERMPKPLIAPKLFVTDITPEAMQQRLFEQGGKMAVIADEGGIFEILSGLYSNGQANIDVFLQGYSGGDVRVHRVSREVEIEKAAIALGLTVQPKVILDLQGE